MYFVYILRSQKDNRLYVGLTSDIEKRLRYHNLGYVRSTSKRRPFTVLYTESFGTRIAARERDKFLKSYSGSKEKLEIIERAIKAPSSNG